MATLYERLIAVGDEPTIHIAGFIGMMRDVKAGNLTVQNIIDTFNLSASQQADAQTIYSAINTATDPQERERLKTT